MKIFEANKACKNIDGIILIKDVSISISQGEKVAIIGKNGSGKSSLLKLIGGIFMETEGHVNRAPMNFGYVPEHFPENIRFKIHDYLMLVGKMSSQPDDELQIRIENYAERFAITDFLTTPLKNCSKGTKQKVGIIQALLNSPDILLLDEPLTGLDEQAKNELLNQLNALEKDKTMIFTTHDSLLMEGLASRVITVDDGEIVSDSTLYKKEKVRTILARIPSRDVMEEVPTKSHEYVGEDSVEILVSAKESDQVLSLLLEKGCSVLEVTEKR